MPPVSELFEVRQIPNAGRGVIATTAIATDTLVFESGPPAFHVIFADYRKETCAQCFHWDRGRTLPVRENDLNKTFCSQECRHTWFGEHSPAALEAWRALSVFIRSKGKLICDRISHEDPRPDSDVVQSEWHQAEKQAILVRQAREQPSGKGAGGKTRKSDRAALSTAMSKSYPDILSYHLSGHLARFYQPEQWIEGVRDLAMDETPYRSSNELQAHCHSMIQLMSILPLDLATIDLVEACSTVAKADNHNAFGINAGTNDEEHEEYMGYAVFPNASYFNHSCEPNLKKQRVGRTWQFRAIRDIAAGEEICITYLGGAEKELDTTQRQQRLKEVWGFHCGCDKCKLESAG